MKFSWALMPSREAPRMTVLAAAKGVRRVAKVLTFLGAAGRAGLGIEIENEVRASVVRELDGLVAGGRELDVRDGFADR